MSENETRRKKNERISYQEHIVAPFSTHLILLEKFRRDVTNHTLKGHQIRS